MQLRTRKRRVLARPATRRQCRAQRTVEADAAGGVDGDALGDGEALGEQEGDGSDEPATVGPATMTRSDRSTRMTVAVTTPISLACTRIPLSVYRRGGRLRFAGSGRPFAPGERDSCDRGICRCWMRLCASVMQPHPTDGTSRSTASVPVAKVTTSPSASTASTSYPCLRMVSAPVCAAVGSKTSV